MIISLHVLNFKIILWSNTNCMKHICLFLFLLSVQGDLFAQMDFSGASIKSDCKKSVEFEEDKKLGVVKVYKAGAHSISRTYVRLLMREYSIKLIETDLFVISDTMLCYNKFSLPFVYKKYGKSVFSKTKFFLIFCDCPRP